MNYNLNWHVIYLFQQAFKHQSLLWVSVIHHSLAEIKTGNPENTNPTP